jgi:hypothetical protein
MIPEALGAILWLSRLGIRSKNVGVRAEHGYADPGYRPATVPAVSLVGPLTVEAEPEHNQPLLGDVLIQLPGYELGAPRAAELVAAGSTLQAVFDGSATATITLPAGDFASPANARALCAAIEAAFRATAEADGFVEESGAPVTDPARRAELARITCRWDAERRRVALSSGRRGAVAQLHPSSVAVSGGTAAAALGLAAPALSASGRYVRQRLPAPKGYAVDIRLDLWAASQRDLALLVEALLRAIPTRKRIATRPGLLAVDLAPGDTSLRLLRQGEPTSSLSLLHLEGSDGFRDRVSGRELERSAGATALADPPRLRFDGSGVAGRVLVVAPSVPDPSRPAEVAPTGASLALALQLEGGGAGDQGRIATAEQDGHSLLRLDYAIVSANGTLVVDLVASAELERESGGFAAASTTRRLPLADLQAGVALHLAVSAARGDVAVVVDGTAQNLANGAETPVPPTLAPGRPPSGAGLQVRLGSPDGTAVPFVLGYVHLLGAPLPCQDPRLRGSVAKANEFQPGDYIALGESDNGVLIRDTAEGFHVRSVVGDTLALDRPVTGFWRRGTTLVHGRCCFLHQRAVKRRDDLMNRLYRYCVTYRVSTWLDDPVPAIFSGLVSEPVVEVNPLAAPARLAAASPGVRATDDQL